MGLNHQNQVEALSPERTDELATSAVVAFWWRKIPSASRISWEILPKYTIICAEGIHMCISLCIVYIYIYINIGHLIAVLVVYVLKKYGKVSTNLKTSSIEIVNVT